MMCIFDRIGVITSIENILSLKFNAYPTVNAIH